MSTTVTFDIASDDDKLRAAVLDVKDDQVLTWRLAVFTCQLMLERAIKAQAVTEHYAKRAKARRYLKQMIEDKGDFRAGLGVDLSEWPSLAVPSEEQQP